ncbi:MAG: MFS transporter [Anaerolineae bacterium]
MPGPPLVVNDLQVRETWFAVLQLAQSVSMVLSGALVAVLAARFKSTRIASVCLFCVGVAVALVAGVSSVAGLIVVLFAVGWFMTPLQASLMTLLQNNVVDAMRGRAGAALSMAAQTASVVSMAGAGVLSDAIGPRNVFLLGGAITAAAGVLSAVIFHGQDEMPQSAGPGGEIPRQRPAAE